MELEGKLRQLSFGTTQERRQFPYYCAPDRLGTELVPIRGPPHIGPATYEVDKVTGIMYYLNAKPQSKKGYTLGARAAQRFPPSWKDVPPPSLWIKERIFTPNFAPFSANAERFETRISDSMLFPGPGSYSCEVHQNRKVSWPMKFGAPDWSLVPSLAKRTLKSELLTDKEFRKKRSRIAYLSLYYS
ncbi:protein pitchfork-like isoform X2 [Rhinatrema bivittatum]|uniref:LOW QUALITY PROTEIN: protein pitchfork-like n=1 Tax=Rhinatrema bivittatum TaxID=194408 RepID=UPI00112642FF|nr:LOW QUALITY PROTEIN: protein pitchfork-like [Rhinatrema bivittatum]XP_029429808.1 protein pitchfork-like isoform X1 [Rhinatrema bivittatum]XP_029429809.1 protein pitchfork-like isoform X2 [Rhinatrema bivittatum]